MQAISHEIKKQIKFWYAHQIWDSLTLYLRAKGFSANEMHPEKDRIFKNLLNISKCSLQEKLELFEVYSLRRATPTNEYCAVEEMFASEFCGLDLPDFVQDHLKRMMDYVLTFQELSTLDPTNKNKLHKPDGIPVYS